MLPHRSLLQQLQQPLDPRNSPHDHLTIPEIMADRYELGEACLHQSPQKAVALPFEYALGGRSHN